MGEIQQLFFGGLFLSRIFEELQNPAIQTTVVPHFGGFFHQMKVRQPIGRKDSTQTVFRKSWRLEAFYLKRLRTVKSFDIFKIKIKKSKTFSGSCPYQGLSDGTTLIRI
jgi:hypothetical protein